MVFLGGRMRVKTLVVGDGRRQWSVLAAALLWAVLLLILAPGSRGEPAAQPKVDDDPEGAPYVAGELLVAYEPGTSEEAEGTVVRQSGARTLQDLPGEARLVSFPEIRREASEAARERALARELRDLEHKAGVEAADYNYLRRPYFTPNDPKLGNQWGLTKARFRGAWNDAKGGGAKVAIVDSGVSSGHPDIGKIAAQKDFVEGNAVADDDYGHGTRVTGIAGALTDNGKGMAGGCFKCGLLIAKVMGANGFATDSKIIKGIDWSVDRGADVVNLSLGGPAYSGALGRAVNRASARGAVVVAAAGNEEDEGETVPRGVFECDRRERHQPGRPSGRLLQPRRLGGSGRAGEGHTLTRKSGGYSNQSGTSFSAPFVSGLAGLLASQGMSADSIRQRMQDHRQGPRARGGRSPLRARQDRRRQRREVSRGLASTSSLG